jgi:hypothetical protein
MDDSQDSAARTPQTHRFVSEREMMEYLNRALWEIERRRAQEQHCSGGE